jgi:hypothetical protein
MKELCKGKWSRIFDKNRMQDQKVDKKNNRWLCSDVPVVMHGYPKFPSSVMVLGVISNESDVMGPHIFAKGLRLNAEEYVKVVDEGVK